MNNFELILIIGISITVLLFILMIVALAQFIYFGSQEKKLKEERPKSRRKRRSWRSQLRRLEKTKTKKMRLFLFSILGTLIIGGGTGYAKYYQSTTISQQDIDNIVYGYYLIEQIEEQLNGIDSMDDKKASDNIHTLGISLSSFSSKKGSDRSVQEAQILLNRYYSSIGQFGLNISSQNFSELKENKDLQKEYISDIATVKESQNKVIAYYKINESSLKEKK